MGSRTGTTVTLPSLTRVAVTCGATALLVFACPRRSVAPGARTRESTAVVRVSRKAPPTVTRSVAPSPTRAWSLALPDLGIETLPTALAAGGGRVFLAAADGALLAIEARSRHSIWRVSPPTGRSVVRRLLRAPRGELLALAGPGDSVSVFAEATGRELRRWSSRAFLQGGCSSSAGRILFGTLDSIALVATDAGGRLRRGSMLPWPQFAFAHPLQRQVVMAGDGTGACVVALATGPGYAVYRDDRLERLVPYVEYVPTPNVRVSERFEDAGTRVLTSHMSIQAVAARDVAVLDGVIYVTFEGRTERAGRIIDRFDLRTGRYIGTLALDADVRRLTAGDGCLYAATYEQGVPTLTCFVATPHAR